MTEENKNIKNVIIEDQLKEAYLDYSMSVIVGRALPDVRDGLKPVHRRILFAMKDMGLTHSKPFVKCARIIGECFKYHPHGDAALYESLVRMAQTFSLRYPLIFGHGNFGSIDFQQPAQMRYCLTGDSLLVTEKGLIRIDQLSKKENIKLKILSKDKKVNNASKWFDSDEHPTLKIITNKGYKLQGSFNHPILTLTRNEFGKPILIWKRLDQIKIGDITVIDRSDNILWPKKINLEKYKPEIKNKRREVKILPKYMSKNLSHVLGALVAEGRINEKEIEFCNSDFKWIKLFEENWNKVFPDCKLHKFDKKPSSYGKKDYKTIEIHSQYVLEFLRSLGLKPSKSPDRRVPEIIFKSPKKIIQEFLKSYFEGDGGASQANNMKELSCCSRSEKLIEDIQILLLRFGIATTKRFDKYKNLHKLYIRGLKDYKLFKEKIDFISDIKKLKLSKLIETSKKEMSVTDFVPYLSSYIRSFVNNGENSKFIYKNNFDRYGNMQNNYQKVSQILLEKTNEDFKPLFEYLLENNYLFDPITNIEFGGIKRVYSIRVDSECHSFIANGFINHNTEAKLSKIAEEVLIDIEKNTVDFVPNFDGSLKEPLVLPSKIPNLLVNGSSGIAVGMTTNIPPHNINEVCNATIALIDNDEITDQELISYVKGPDFPTGGLIIGVNGIKQAYKNGRGKIIIRARTIIEKNTIIITEIPYQVDKSMLIENIANLVNEKTIEGISDIRDESAKEGMRILIEIKKNSDPNIVLNQLYKHSQLQTTFGIINLALVDGEPKILSLKNICLEFIKHRKFVVTRRTKYELKKAEERDHILQGLLIALNKIDEIIKLIKDSNDVETARSGLISNYILTELQANAILDMKLSKLAALEQQKILNEHNELLKFIEEMKNILASETRIYKIIKDELVEIKDEYSDKRKTEIIEGEDEVLETEDLIEKENIVVTITHSGYIKRQALDVYKGQRRGGKGIIGTETKDEEDFVENLFVANTHSYILFFTDKGVVHWLKAYKIPEAGRYARGTALVNIIKLNEGEKITSVVAVDEFKEDNYLVMATKKGIIKKTSLVEYSRPRQGGIIGINLRDDDKLINVQMTDGNKQLIIATKDGRAVRFKESDVKAVGRNSIGVSGIKVRNSEVIGMEIINAPYLLTLTEKGYGKRSEVNEYRLINRGGSGVTNIKITEKNSNVIGIKVVNENDEIMLISKNGVIIRTPISGISVIGRNTQGVRIMNIENGDSLATIARIINEEKDIEIKEEFKPSEEIVVPDNNSNGEEEIDNNESETNIEIKDEDKKDSENINEENKVDTNEKENNESLDKNNLSNENEKPSVKKDFTLDGYEE